MRSLLQNYYKMNDEEKSKINDLLIIHMIESKIKEYSDLDLDLNDEGAILQLVKDISKMTDIKYEIIVDRIFEMLNTPDTTVEDLVDIGVDELIDIITDFDYTDKKEKYEIIKEFMYKDYCCVFMKEGTKYILAFDNNEDSHAEIFESLEGLLCYIVKNKLLDFGEDSV